MKKAALALAALAASLAVSLVLGGCPNPIDSSEAKQMLDKTAPVVRITSPAEGSTYSQTVTVQGAATDAGKVRTVSYEVSGTLGLLLNGQIPASGIGGGGAFSFEFSTISFNGPVVVKVTAEDWNDNAADATVTLQYPGSSISSFAAAPGNKHVQLSWEAVPGASGYTIYYTSNGTLPTETFGQSVSLAGTSYDLTGLRNGAPHTFLLKAALTAGGAYYSSYVTSIPLSPLTLAPLVTGGYRQISLEWQQIPATSQFEVLRSSSPSGPFDDYTGVIQGNGFVDTGVSDGVWYYYKVRPALAGSVESAANAAQTFLIPPTSDSGIVDLNTSGPANKVKVLGSYAYVAAGSAGLLVVDVSNPRFPAVVASVATTNARDVDLYDYGGGVVYAFVADGSGKLRAINVSNPLAPALAGTYAGTLGDAIAVAAEAGHGRIYVIDGSGSTTLLAINVATPGTMSLITSLGGGSYQFKDLDVSYYSSSLTFVYLTTTNSDVLVEDYLSSGTTFFTYRTYTDPDSSPGYRADYVDVSGSYVYVLGAARAYLEPPPPYAVLVLSKYPSPLTRVGESGSSNGNISDIQVVGSKAYLADGRGLQVVDVSNPAAPALTDFWNTPGASTGVASNGSFSFVTSGTLGFQTVDLSLPNSPTVVGSYGSFALNGIAARDRYLYAASFGGARLQILDVINPASPAAVTGGNVSIPGASDVALSGTYAFVAAGTNGLKVVDVSSPSSPAIVGSAAPISGSVGRVAVKGDYAYLAGSTGLQVYDVADPTHPFGVGFFDADGQGGIQDVAIRGSYVYASEGAYFQPNNLKIIDMSNPTQPQLKDRASFGMILHNVSLEGDYAYVTDQFPGNGLYAVNINPSSGAYLAVYGPCETVPGSPGTGAAHAVAAFGEYAYVGDTQSGFAVVDISNPTQMGDPRLIRTLDWTSSAPEDMVLSGKYAYVTDSAVGLKAVRLFP